MIISIRLYLLAIFAITLVQGEDFPFKESIRSIYHNYKQCENELEIAPCLKMKALKVIDRALAINSIPILEGMALTKKEDGQRSMNNVEQITLFDEKNLPVDPKARNEKIDSALWAKVEEFFETRSLQLKMDELLFGEDEEGGNGEEARGKRKKNRGMYMYLLMMKGGMIAMAYKALALLAGKALIVSKIALTLALVVAIKKLFGGGHNTQKTTYEIVKTPIVTHSHQYSGATPQSGHFGGEFNSYESGPYARNLENPTEETNRRAGSRPPLSPIRYMTHVVETEEGRSLSNGSQSYENSAQANGAIDSYNDGGTYNSHPYANLIAYRNKLNRNNGQTRQNFNN